MTKAVKNGTEIHVYHDTSLKFRAGSGKCYYHNCYRADISVFAGGERTARTRKRFATAAEAHEWLGQAGHQIDNPKWL